MECNEIHGPVWEPAQCADIGLSDTPYMNHLRVSQLRQDREQGTRNKDRDTDTVWLFLPDSTETRYEQFQVKIGHGVYKNGMDYGLLIAVCIFSKAKR